MAVVSDEPPKHGSLVEALFAFRAEVRADLKLRKDATNPHFGSGFASLDEIAKVDPLLHKHGLLWMTMPTIADGKSALRYKLIHVPTGDREEDVMLLLLDKENPQGLGSAHTYGRRQAKTTVLDLRAEDDDGNAGSTPPRARAGYGVNPRGGTSVNVTHAAKGLSDRAINEARERAGLERVEETGNLPWKSLLSIQPEKATALEDALARVKAAEG